MMKTRTIFGIVGIIIGIGFLGVSGVHYWMVAAIEPSLKGIDIGAHPEFGFASIADWKRTALIPTVAIAVFGAASIACGVQVFLRNAIALMVGMAASLTVLATYAILLLLRSDLWLDFLWLPAIGLAEFIETRRHNTRRQIPLNRVAGGFSPPAPTPPGMRVRTRRFP